MKPSEISRSASLPCTTIESVLYHQSQHIIQPLKLEGCNNDPFPFTRVTRPENLPNPGEIEIKVNAWSISAEDTLTIFSCSNPNFSQTAIGGFQGTVTSVGCQDHWKVGDQICGWSNDILSNSIRVATDNVCQYPTSISIGEAASIPVLFMMSFYAVVEISRIKKGQTIIIYDAGSPIGQAVIQVARYIGAKVIAITTKAEDWLFLIDDYGLPSDRIIFQSDSATFDFAIRRLTNNGGAQLVLHSSPGDEKVIEKSITCLVRFGAFVHNGSIESSSKIAAAIFDKNISVTSLDLARTSELQPQLMVKLMRHVNTMLKNHHSMSIKPALTLSIGDTENAVKRIQQESLTGQIVLQANDTKMMNLVSMPPPLNFNEDATYLVLGNSITLSIDMYKFLVLHGAKSVVMMFTGTLKEKIKIEGILAHEEANIRFVASVEELLTQLHDMPSINGIMYTELICMVS